MNGTTKVVDIQELSSPAFAPYLACQDRLNTVEIQPNGFGFTGTQVGGSVAGNARKNLEQRLGRPIITKQNAARLDHIVSQMIKASIKATDEEFASGKLPEVFYIFISAVLSNGKHDLINQSCRNALQFLCLQFIAEIMLH